LHEFRRPCLLSNGVAMRVSDGRFRSPAAVTPDLPSIGWRSDLLFESEQVRAAANSRFSEGWHELYGPSTKGEAPWEISGSRLG
jgi:hypothetical protein